MLMLIEQLYQISNFSDEARKELEKLLSIKTYKAGELIQDVDGNCNSIYIILEGCVKGFTKDRAIYEKDACYFIGFKGDIVTVPYAFIKKDNGKGIKLQALEETTVECLGFDNIDKMYHKFPELMKLGMTILGEYYLFFFSEFLKMITLSPIERYLKLIEQRPKILERVPLSVIASYLGISRAHLNRIRT